MRYRIQTLNNVSVRGLERLPRESYEIATDIGQPDAIIVRSADMHAMTIPASVLAVGRAGAGVNNVPVAALSKRGVPVFNAPGANANAVTHAISAKPGRSQSPSVVTIRRSTKLPRKVKRTLSASSCRGARLAS